MRSSRVLRSGIVGLTLTVMLLVSLATGRSMSAFTGTLRNTGNSVRIAVQTCRAAELADRPIRMYSLAKNGGGTNQGTAGPGTDATFYGDLLGGFASGGGCRHDPQSYFDFTPGVLGILLARWVTTAGSTAITAQSVLTQEAWVRTSTRKGLIMGFGNNRTVANGSTVKGLQVFFGPNGRIDFATHRGGVNTELRTTASFADGQWHHVVAVYDAGAKKLYVDGQLRASGTGPSETIGTAYWRLGNDSLSGWNHAPTGLNSTFLDGGMQYAALYTTALTADQVRAHYRAGLP